MKRTFRTTVYAVVSGGGAFRLFDQKSIAMTHIKGLKDMGIVSSLWKCKPTWRRLG